MFTQRCSDYLHIHHLIPLLFSFSFLFASFPGRDTDEVGISTSGSISMTETFALLCNILLEIVIPVKPAILLGMILWAFQKLILRSHTRGLLQH